MRFFLGLLIIVFFMAINNMYLYIGGNFDITNIIMFFVFTYAWHIVCKYLGGA